MNQDGNNEFIIFKKIKKFDLTQPTILVRRFSDMN